MVSVDDDESAEGAANRPEEQQDRSVGRRTSGRIVINRSGSMSELRHASSFKGHTSDGSLHHGHGSLARSMTTKGDSAHGGSN